MKKEVIDADQKPLSELQIVKLQKAQADITSAMAKLGDTVEPLGVESNPIKALVPGYVMNKVAVVTAHKDTVLAALALALEQKSGVLQNLKIQVAECKAELKEVNRMATVQIQEAQGVNA